MTWKPRQIAHDSCPLCGGPAIEDLGLDETYDVRPFARSLITRVGHCRDCDATWLVLQRTVAEKGGLARRRKALHGKENRDVRRACPPFSAARRWQVREMGTGTIDFTVHPVASLRRDGASPRFAAADPAL